MFYAQSTGAVISGRWRRRRRRKKKKNKNKKNKKKINKPTNEQNEPILYGLNSLTWLLAARGQGLGAVLVLEPVCGGGGGGGGGGVLLARRPHRHHLQGQHVAGGPDELHHSLVRRPGNALPVDLRRAHREQMKRLIGRGVDGGVGVGVGKEIVRWAG